MLIFDLRGDTVLLCLESGDLGGSCAFYEGIVSILGDSYDWTISDATVNHA